MVLALMRLWDTPRHALRLEHIARTLRDPHIIDALAADGHKWMLGPEGCGILYVRAERQDEINRLLVDRGRPA